MNVIRAIVVTNLFLLLSATAQDSPKLPTLDDYPKPVVEHLLQTFNTERDKLSEEGAPKTIDDLSQPCAGSAEHENAFALYQKAFKAELLSERLNLLAQAAALPCFEYPLAKRKLGNLFVKSYSIDFELFGEMRDATRILVDESRIRLTSGDTDGAIDMLCACFGLLDHMTQLPAPLMQLTRYACQDLVLGAFRDVIASATLYGDRLDRLAEAVARSNAPDTLARTWLFERALDNTLTPFQGAETIHIFDGVARAQLTAARTVIAVERYLQAHGKCPESIADLVPDFLDAVPTDPMIGEPLRYEMNDTHFAVFSVGMDGKPMAEPFAWTRGDAMEERTVVLVPVTKSMIPLGKMSLHFEHESRPNTQEEQAAMQSVSDATISSLLHLEPRIVSFSAGPLEGGVAVLLVSVTPNEDNAESIPVMAGFWAKDGVLHAVNHVASGLAPELPTAPDSVTFTRLRDVVH